MNTIILLSAILIILFIIYIILSNISTPSLRLITDKKLDLSKEQLVLNSDDAKRILLQSGSSLMAYVYLEQGNKTKSVEQTIIKQDGIWALNLNNGEPVLIVKTLNGTENIRLPVLSYQKWIAITLVRDGRRFDIYYNGELVLSHRMKSYIASQLAPLKTGSVALQGGITHIYSASRILSGQDIYNLYKKTSDTRGRPYIKEDTVIIPKIGCPSGPLCPTSTPPPNPYKKWVTQYS
jgi:hypothetical protein